MDDLTRAWATYLDVLAVEAPVTRAALLPARELDIDSAQQELGLPLLPDLVTWFGLHGGSGFTFDCAILPFGMALDLPDAVSSSMMRRRIGDESVDDLDLDAEEAEMAGSMVFTWRDEYLMIGEAGDGGGMFVDQRPGPDQGCA